MVEEDYFFSTTTEEISHQKKAYVLIIYDIDWKCKTGSMAKFLQGYGFRVQKSAFEAMISLPLYHKLMREIRAFISEEDSIRIYKIIGQGQVTVLGKNDKPENDDCIII